MLQLKRIWSRLKRGSFFALLLLLFYLMQNIVLSHIAPLGVRALFLPALVVAVGHFEGGWRGGLFGLAAGVLSDLGGTEPSLLFTILYPVMGFVTGFLTEFLVNQRFYAYCISAGVCLFAAAFFQMFPLLAAFPGSAGSLWLTCILQTLWSLPYMIPSYYACKALPRRLG